MIITVCSFEGWTQINHADRACFGIYRYYNLPLFNFAKQNYQLGKGISVTYLSRKISLLKEKDLSLRFMATFGASGQGKRTFTISHIYNSDSIPERQYFYNTHFYFGLGGRVTYEKKRIVKPYMESLIGMGVFDSYESFSPDIYKKTSPEISYYANPAIFGVSVGCLVRIIDEVYLDGKITYTQAFKRIYFANLDKFTYEDPAYLPQVQNATPSLITFHLGVLFIIPKISVGWGSPGEFSTPSQNNYDYPSAPSPQNVPNNYEPLPNNDSSPKENPSPNEEPRIKH